MASCKRFLPLITITGDQFLVDGGKGVGAEKVFNPEQLKAPSFFFVVAFAIVFRRKLLAEPIDQVFNGCPFCLAG